MFTYYTKAIALSILTLSASCSLYSMKPSLKRIRESLSQPSSEKEESSGEMIEKNPSITLPGIRATFRESYAKESSKKEPSLSETMKKAPSITLPVAIDPTTKKASVLLFSTKGSSWNAFLNNIKGHEFAGLMLGLITIGEGKTAQYPYANLDFRNVTPEMTAEGHLKNKPVYIAPINFIPAGSIKMEGGKEANLEFVWIPVDEFVSHMTVVARPLSTMGLTGKPNLANVDYSINQFIKANANKIKAATAKPLPKVEEES